MLNTLELKAETIISIYQPIKEDEIKETSFWAPSVLPGACPEHVYVRALLEQERSVCETEEQHIKLARFFTAYQDVFSQKNFR